MGGEAGSAEPSYKRSGRVSQQQVHWSWQESGPWTSQSLGECLDPGLRPLCRGRSGGSRAVPSGFPNKRFVSPRWRNFSPKRASGAHILCRDLAGGHRQWAASDGVGWVAPTFLLPGSPHTLQAPLQRKAFLWYLEKSCGGKGRAAAGSSLWEVQGEPCAPRPCSGPF